jgi:hypothetical protein
MNKRIASSILSGLALMLLVGWLLGWFQGADRQVSELEKLRDEGFARREQMSPEEQRQSGEEFRAKLQGLSEAQRQAFFESSAPIFMKMFEARLDQFFALTPEKQQAELDKQIDRMQRGLGQAGPGGGGPQGPPGGTPPSPQRIDEMRKKMLDWTTPEQRAKFESAMQMFQKRLQERGINPPSGGGFF